jgi:hypothetical protein
MKTHLLYTGLGLAALTLVIGAGLSTAAQKPVTVQVYKTPTCGCCSLWVKHLEANGFVTKVTDMDDLSAVKQTYGVPARASSCHTAVVDGYAIEGHVPAADVRRLLKERPKVAGLAVPGMPLGSPGMEVGNQKQPYDVLAFEKGGATKVFSSYGR